MKIFNQIQELQNEGVITPETALDISNYYKSKNKESSSTSAIELSKVYGSVNMYINLFPFFH